MFSRLTVKKLMLANIAFLIFTIITVSMFLLYKTYSITITTESIYNKSFVGLNDQSKLSLEFERQYSIIGQIDGSIDIDEIQMLKDNFDSRNLVIEETLSSFKDKEFMSNNEMNNRVKKLEELNTELMKQTNVLFQFSKDMATTQAHEHYLNKIIPLINDIGVIIDTSIVEFNMAAKTDTEGLVSASKAYLKYTPIILGIILLLIGVESFFVSYKISNQLNAVAEAIDKLSKGDVTAIIPEIKRKDEINKIAQGLQVFKDNLILNRKLQEQKEVEIRTETKRKEVMHNLANDFGERMQKIVSAVAAASSQLGETAEYMNSRIDQSTQTISSTEDEAKETSSYVDRVAGSAHELYSSVSEISQQVHKANELIVDSVYKVQSADVHAKKLGEASGKVREVIQLIADISSQINLLALNATIESARAGEAGKGFAVVANEVKNLANQTNKSVEEIGKVIDEMGIVSGDIIEALGGVREAVDNISQASVGIASAVEEQTVATNGIAQSAKEASQGASNIYSGLSVIKNASYEVNSSSQQVLSAARGLALQSEDLGLS